MSNLDSPVDWIKRIASTFNLISLRHAITRSSETNYVYLTYKWPKDTGSGIIRFFYDSESFLAVFSVTFRKSFEHFRLPDLRNASTVLYFDEVSSCFLKNSNISLTPPDSHFVSNTESFVLFPHTFYLKTDGPFDSMCCSSDASATGIFLVTKDKTLIPPFHFSDIYICLSTSQSSLKSMITDLLHYPYENKSAEFFFRGKILEFLSYLISEQKDLNAFSLSSKDTDSEINQVLKSEEKNILHVMKYIREHPDVSLSSEQISREANMSLAKLKYCFKKLTGMTMAEYKTDFFMKKACELLWSTDMKVSKIADICGYQSTASFGAAFKKKIGISPLQYRKRT